MLPKKYRLSKKEFNSLFCQKGIALKRGFLRLRASRNNLSFSRFGVTVGLKVSKRAVKRNKTKRRLNEILRSNLPQIKTGFDILIFAQPEILNKSYQEIEKTLLLLLKEASLLKTKS